MESLFDYLSTHGNDLSDHDLAHLADWASHWKDTVRNPSWKRAYALIREGADLLLRRRAMSAATGDNHMGQPRPREEDLCASDEAGIVCGQPKSAHTKEAARGDVGMDHAFVQKPVQSQTLDYLHLRQQIGDFSSTFYGPHACEICGMLIVKQAIEQGGKMWMELKDGLYEEHLHGSVQTRKEKLKAA